jgi:hypothetical protein
VDVLLDIGSLRLDQKECLAYLILSNLEGADLFLMEWFEIDQRNKSAREERLMMQARANKDLMRNLAHEIKEYTHIINKETNGNKIKTNIEDNQKKVGKAPSKPDITPISNKL